jgi:hypothetical protein
MLYSGSLKQKEKFLPVSTWLIDYSKCGLSKRYGFQAFHLGCYVAQLKSKQSQNKLYLFPLFVSRRYFGSNK